MTSHFYSLQPNTSWLFNYCARKGACACRCVASVSVKAQQVRGNLSAFFSCIRVFFLWEEGDGNINGDDSPVFCDSGAGRVLFTHFPPLGLAYKTRNGERMKR